MCRMDYKLMVLLISIQISFLRINGRILFKERINLYKNKTASRNIFHNIKNKFIQRKNDPEIVIFFTTSWMILNKQNEAYYDTPYPDPSFLPRSTIVYALEYLEANYGSLS